LRCNTNQQAELGAYGKELLKIAQEGRDGLFKQIESRRR
jgi:hypothetical protein